MRYLLSESNLPLASAINYADAEEVLAYAHLLTVRYSSRLAEKQGHNTFGIIREGRNWLREVERMSSTYPIAVMHDICLTYRRIHRLCWKTDAPDKLITEWCQRLFGSLVKGDPSVSRSNVVMLMQEIISSNPRSFKPEYLRWYMDVTGRWVNDLLKEGTFKNESLCATFSRLTILLREDLYPCFGKEEDTIKIQWIGSHLTIDASEMDLPTLLSYRCFLAAASPYLSTEEQCREQCSLLDREVLTQLALHPDLHPLSRTAYTEELTLYPTESTTKSLYSSPVR